MISICVPDLTRPQLLGWLPNKPVPINAVTSTFYDPAQPLTPKDGYQVQILVDDARWSEVKPVAAALATLVGIQRVRVMFDSLSTSDAGRPAGRVAWVYSDGHQEEA